LEINLMTYPYNSGQQPDSVNNPFLGSQPSQYDPNGLAANPSYSPDPVADYGYNPAPVGGADWQQAASGYDYGAQYGVPGQQQQPQYGVLPQQQQFYAQAPMQSNPPKDKAIAILFCLFFGGFGAHNFYTGFNGMGAAQLVLLLVGWLLSVLLIGIPLLIALGIWVFVDLIMIIAGSGRFAYVFRS